MSPTLSLLLGLIALIPQAFSLSIPANPAAGLTNIISVDTPGTNPLPPPPPGWYHIPGTSLSIHLLPPIGPPLPSPPSALTCLSAAQSAIAATIALHGDIPIPHPSWTFVNSNVALVANPVFPGLGTYGQLASGLKGLLHLITETGGPGPRELSWVLGDEVQGIVLNGAMGPETRIGVLGAEATATATVSSGTVAGVVASATATQSVGIVSVEELVTS